ncbi:hypothetical protein DL95DRAFT_454612 [Leptodontidium sp. 2 PMI_412]|nr:hypothetical protein DL95DRAFT_454612 [Leptodontidium sp. 2 PMI_412]
MDFLASFLTVWVALSFSEPALGYKMLSYACNVGRALGLYQVDSSEDTAKYSQRKDQATPTDILEEDSSRMTFWFLLHYNCIFRLRYRTSALIELRTWTVKVPTIVDDIGNKIGFDPLHFIICTKITLVIMKFFELFEKDELPLEVEYKVSALVEEVIAIAETWKLEENASSADYVRSHRVEFLDIPELKEHALKSARGYLSVLNQMIQIDSTSSWPTSIRFLWLLNSYLNIYRSILQTSDPTKSLSDLESLVWLESKLEEWSRQYEEVVPLRAAIKGLNKISQHIVDPRKSSSSTSPSNAAPCPKQRGPSTHGQRLPPTKFGVERISFLLASPNPGLEFLIRMENVV